MTSTFKSYCKNNTNYTYQPESIIDIANSSREERMRYLLNIIQGFLNQNKVIQDTKLLRREKRRLSCIENHNPNIKISYFNHEEKGILYSPVRMCFQDSDERKKYLYGSIAEQKIKIPSGNEFNEIINYIEHELKISDVKPEIKVLKSSQSNLDSLEVENVAIIKNEEVKTVKIENEPDKDSICIENIKNNLFDIEYKLKVELKKLEYIENAEEKRKITMDEVTGNDKQFLSNFSNITLDSQNVSNFSSQKREKPFMMSLDFIKEFYVDNKNVGVAKPKRFSIIDELKKEKFFDKNNDLEIDEEKSSDSENIANENQTKVNINEEKKDKPKKKRQSMIVSSLF